MFQHATTPVNSLTAFFFPVETYTLANERPVPRNHHLTDLIDLLAARYPVVRRLAGDESFLGAATGFVVAEPYRKPETSSRSESFGDTFPQFLRSLGPSASIEYLADIGELEMAVSKAQDTSAQRSKRRPTSRSNERTLRITIHPSVRVVESRFPIVTIWEANQTSEGSMIYRWNAEAALVAAPVGMVEIRRLPAGGAAFFRVLINGGTIGEATVAGKSASDAFELAANLAILADARIAAEITAPKAA
jgi:hypothetical protein